MRIYVGNLSADLGAPQLRAMFEAHGDVKSARLAKAKETGDLRGYAIVEMEEDDEAEAAIAALSGFSAGGRKLKVKQAK